MLDKIRMHLAGDIDEAYRPYLGKGFDGRCCEFLRVDYEDLRKLVEEGQSNEEVLAWCCQNGRNWDDMDILMYNSFMVKRGWNDEDPEVSAWLGELKRRTGLAHRDDLKTFFEYLDADEQRR
jgi:gluconokinase